MKSGKAPDPKEVVRRFLCDGIDALLQREIRVTEKKRPKTIAGHGGFEETIVYRFTFRRRRITVNVVVNTVAIDTDVLAMDTFDAVLFRRLIDACVERCVFQDADSTPAVADGNVLVCRNIAAKLLGQRRKKH